MLEGGQIYTAITSDPTIAAIIGDRFYPMQAPDSGAMPYGVYMRITGEQSRTLEGTGSPEEITYALTFWANDLADAENAANQARTVMNNNFSVSRIFDVQTRDEETDSFAVAVTVTFWS